MTTRTDQIIKATEHVLASARAGAGMGEIIDELAALPPGICRGVSEAIGHGALSRAMESAATEEVGR